MQATTDQAEFVDPEGLGEITQPEGESNTEKAKNRFRAGLGFIRSAPRRAVRSVLNNRAFILDGLKVGVVTIGVTGFTFMTLVWAFSISPILGIFALIGALVTAFSATQQTKNLAKLQDNANALVGALVPQAA